VAIAYDRADRLAMPAREKATFDDPTPVTNDDARVFGVGMQSTAATRHEVEHPPPLVVLEAGVRMGAHDLRLQLVGLEPSA
jgi:hypothetical protein